MCSRIRAVVVTPCVQNILRLHLTHANYLSKLTAVVLVASPNVGKTSVFTCHTCFTRLRADEELNCSEVLEDSVRLVWSRPTARRDLLAGLGLRCFDRTGAKRKR